MGLIISWAYPWSPHVYHMSGVYVCTVYKVAFSLHGRARARVRHACAQERGNSRGRGGRARGHAAAPRARPYISLKTIYLCQWHKQHMFYRCNVSFINRGRRAATLSGLSVPFKCAAHMPGKAVRFMAVKRALRPELMKFSRAMVCWSTRVMSHAHSSLSHPTQPAAQSCDVHCRAASLIHHLAQHLSTVWDVRGDVPNESAPAATGSSHASLPTTHPPDPT